MKKLFAISALLVAWGASAEIQDQGDYVLDTETGLKWVKPTQTLGRTIKDAGDNMGPDQEFAGCRFPVLDEINDLVGKLGIPPGGWCGTYCGLIDPAYEETVEDAIELLGDTRDVAFDAINHATDVAPDGAGWTRAGYGTNATYGLSYPADTGYFVLIKDNELVNRVDGTPLQDDPDQVFTEETLASKPSWNGNAATGLLLICDEWPTNPIASVELDFENQALGNTAPIFQGGWRVDGDATAVDVDGEIWLQTTPCPNCPKPYSTSMTLSRDDGKPFALMDLRPWGTLGSCKSGIQGTPLEIKKMCNYSGLTTWGERVYGYFADDPEEGFGPWLSLQSATIQLTHLEGEYFQTNCSDDCQFWADRAVVAENQPIEVDFDPWNSADIIDPTTNAVVTVQISTTPDFDSAEVNPETLRLSSDGKPDSAAKLASPFAIIVQDIDGDGDTDHTFGFNTFDTGILCNDNRLILWGQTNAGIPFAESIPVNISDNCFETVQIDVEPFAPNNYVYPDDDYTILVKLNDIDNGNFFDAGTSVNPASVRFGPNHVENVLIPPLEYYPYGNNTDHEPVFGFDMQDSGIACGDTEVELIGLHSPTSTFAKDGPFPSGKPAFKATGSIQTQNCDAGECHP